MTSVSLVYFDTIAAHPRGEYVVPKKGMLFHPLECAEKPANWTSLFEEKPGLSIKEMRGATFEHLTLEVRAPTAEAREKLQKGLQLTLNLNDQFKIPTQLVLFVQVGTDGVAHYNYIFDLTNVPDTVPNGAPRKAADGKGVSCSSRLGFVVEYVLTPEAHEILLGPESSALVWIHGSLREAL